MNANSNFFFCLWIQFADEESEWFPIPPEEKQPSLHLDDEQAATKAKKRPAASVLETEHEAKKARLESLEVQN